MYYERVCGRYDYLLIVNIVISKLSFKAFEAPGNLDSTKTDALIYQRTKRKNWFVS